MSGSPEANLPGEELVAAIMAHNYVITNIDMLDENTGGRVGPPPARWLHKPHAAQASQPAGG